MPDDIDPMAFAESCRFINSDALFEAGMSLGETRRTAFPTALLSLEMPDFALDCFSWEAFILVSERLRLTLDLPDDTVDYHPVDASASAALPRSKNYMIMSVAVTERVSRPGVSNPFIYGVDSIDVFAEVWNARYSTTRPLSARCFARTTSLSVCWRAAVAASGSSPRKAATSFAPCDIARFAAWKKSAG